MISGSAIRRLCPLGYTRGKQSGVVSQGSGVSNFYECEFLDLSSKTIDSGLKTFEPVLKMVHAEGFEPSISGF